MWISRDEFEYELWGKKPERNSDDMWSTGKECLYMDLCPDDFERITGIKLKEGELRKVKITKFKNGFAFTCS